MTYDLNEESMWQSDEGSTVSFWQATEDDPKISGGAPPSAADVCVIGAGISGLTTAYLLAKAGRQVTVIDDGPIAGGETARTTAHLSCAIDDRIYRIEKWHGEEKAKLAVESHSRAIDEIQRIIGDERIDCDFRRLDGFLVEAEDGEDDLEQELDSAHRLGFREIELIDGPPVKGFGDARALRFPNQAQFHILKYLAGLAASIQQAGGSIVPNTRAVEWTGEERPKVKTAKGITIEASSLVLATNYPIQSKMFAKLPAYRTYAIGASLIKGAIAPMLLWDTLDPYHYVRTHEENDRDVLIVGGEDHRTGHENDGNERFERLRRWTANHFPVKEFPYEWSGQVFETYDGLAFIGRFSEGEPNVYLITGDSGMGMTHGTIGGMLVSDLILGRDNPWVDVYEPSRIATQSITEAVPEVVASTVPYKEWVTSGDVSSYDEIKNGQGAVVRDGLKKIAAFRDDKGELHLRSAVCTHMGCIVRFNSAEKTWDCPCHGSRFGTDGHPINTPAVTPLEKIEEET